MDRFDLQSCEEGIYHRDVPAVALAQCFAPLGLCTGLSGKPGIETAARHAQNQGLQHHPIRATSLVGFREVRRSSESALAWFVPSDTVN